MKSALIRSWSQGHMTEWKGPRTRTHPQLTRSSVASKRTPSLSSCDWVAVSAGQVMLRRGWGVSDGGGAAPRGAGGGSGSPTQRVCFYLNSKGVCALCSACDTGKWMLRTNVQENGRAGRLPLPCWATLYALRWRGAWITHTAHTRPTRTAHAHTHA